MKKALTNTAAALGEVLRAKNLRLATAESCTGGLVSMALCSSGDTADFYSCGFITFDDNAKHKLLGVSKASLEKYTAVSKRVVAEMASGAINYSGEDVSLSVSGYAGPEGGEDGTPPGTIWFGWTLPDRKTVCELRHFEGNCEEVIEQAVIFSIERLKEMIQ